MYALDYALNGIPVSQVFTAPEYNGHSQNWEILQAEDGNIRVANGHGILEWNGEFWSKYPTPNRTRVRSFTQGFDGKIYLGTTNDFGRLQASANGELIFESLLKDDAYEKTFGDIWSVVADDDAVVFSSKKKIFVWNGQTLAVVPDFEPGPNRLFNYRGRLIVFTYDKGLFQITTGDKQSALSMPLPKGFPDKNIVRDIFALDGNRALIVTSKQGVYVWEGDEAALVIRPEEFEENTILYSAYLASDGYLYLGSLAHGLYIASPQFQLLRRYNSTQGIGTNTVLDILEDKQKNIWLAGDAAISHFQPPHHYSVYDDGGVATGAFNLRMFRGQPVITGMGIFQLQASSGALAAPMIEPLSGWRHQTWDLLELDDVTLAASEKGVFALDISTQGEVRSSKNIASATFAFDLEIDPNNSDVIYAATSEGLLRIQRQDAGFEAVHVEGVDDTLETLEVDASGAVWAGTSHGLLYLADKIDSTGTPGQLHTFGAAQGLPAGNVFPFKIAGKVLLGTTDGLKEYNRGENPVFVTASGMPGILTEQGRDIFRLTEDALGNLWFRAGEITGVSYKQPNGKWRTDVDLFKPLSQTAAVGLLPMEDGHVQVLFQDDSYYRLSPNWKPRNYAFGKLGIRKIVDPDSQQLLSVPGRGEQLSSLQHKNNALRMYFSLPEYTLPQRTVYRTRMGGEDAAWSPWSKEYWRDYRNLPGGDYSLEVQSRDGWGHLSETAVVGFAVLKPWYLSYWAIGIYLLLGLLSLLMAALFGQRWRTGYLEQQKKQLEQTVKQRTQKIQTQADELREQQLLKDRFFTNVSHEFRTPLTLTIEPLREILGKENIGVDDARELAATALRSSQQMLDLVGQVLDVNRLEVGALKLTVCENDLAELLRSVSERFERWAAQQGQQLQLQGCVDPVLLFFDENQMERCVGNLISNAIKYSGEGSHIIISLQDGDDCVKVSVKDNGVGIDASQQQQIFERYFQGAASSEVTHPGTGIGLSLVKDIIEMHHGEVSLYSNPGDGACFTLSLPRGSSHFSAEELQSTISQTPDNAVTRVELDTEVASGKTLLVVDDNEELRRFLSKKLSAAYHVEQAENGQQGLDLARKILPDLIISDVAMPVMDGFDMVRQLRGEKETLDIPVVLLTAKATKRDTVQGLQMGADDYLTKPFDTSELVVRVNRLLEKRERLRKALVERFNVEVSSKADGSDFKKRLEYTLRKYINDPKLNITLLADELAVSRATLYRKIQQVTGMSAANYIKQARLQLAHDLLKQGEGKVGEVAYACGFESLSAFSKSYKAFYGVSPSTHCSFY